MKQGYSETEGKCYPLFFACKNDSLDIRIDGREQMKAKGKLGLQERKYGGDTPDRGKERGRILY